MFASMIRPLGIAFALLLLAGCQLQRQPQPAAVAQPDPTQQQLQQLGQQSDKRFNTVEQQMTLLQEKLIKLNAQLERLEVQGRQQLALTQHIQQLQSTQMAQPTQAVSQSAGAASNGDTLAQLTELVMRLEQMSSLTAETSVVPEVGVKRPPDYQLVSAYSSQGWVLLKYDTISGTTWKAEGGDWVQVEEVGVLPDSNYKLVIQSAENDVKGYVAARIDRSNGFAWWLKGNSWEPL